MSASTAGTLVRPLERDGGPGRLRPLRREDIPAIVALRRRAFRFGQRRDDQALARYCEEIFCRHPWLDGELPSLVYEDDNGTLAGFLGVLPKPMLLRGEPIRAAVATQLMVAPESRGLAGLRLARAFISGPQDLSLSDTANDVARRLWRSVGGSDSPLHGLTWTLPLRPLRHAAAFDGLAGRIVSRALRPAVIAADAVLARTKRGAAGRRLVGHLAPFDPGVVAEYVNSGAWGDQLRATYTPQTLGWLLARMAEKEQFGPPRGAMVVDDDGGVAGWFLCHARPGGLAQVVALAARPGAESQVFRHVRRDMWRYGARALSGRCDTRFLPQVEACGGRLRSTGPWLLYHARRPEIAREIERGDARISRLDGEWWLSF